MEPFPWPKLVAVETEIAVSAFLGVLHRSVPAAARPGLLRARPIHPAELRRQRAVQWSEDAAVEVVVARAEEVLAVALNRLKN